MYGQLYDSDTGKFKINLDLYSIQCEQLKGWENQRILVTSFEDIPRLSKEEADALMEKEREEKLKYKEEMKALKLETERLKEIRRKEREVKREEKARLKRIEDEERDKRIMEMARRAPYINCIHISPEKLNSNQWKQEVNSMWQEIKKYWEEKQENGRNVG